MRNFILNVSDILRKTFLNSGAVEKGPSTSLYFQQIPALVFIRRSVYVDRPVNFFRQIPSVHELIQIPMIRGAIEGFSRDSVIRVVRTTLQMIRDDLSHQKEMWDTKKIQLKILSEFQHLKSSQFRRVINATGVLIHTNLGRAPLSQDALYKAVEIGRGYSTVEYDLKKGERGERNDIIETMLCLLTGAESAIVVNNNAAAILLSLNTLAENREVLVSRGELVEIGNSFRLPDIMEKSGAHLKEVGTTNKTKIQDYRKAFNSQTALVLKVHTSNYEIVGFTEEVFLEDLVKIAHQKRIPILFDAGSGLLFKSELLQTFQRFSSKEPFVKDAIVAGIDLVAFSGDKLLGGPQTGIVVGRKKWISLLKKNPLYRTLRIDKILLAILEETLRHYLLDEAETKIPFYKMLSEPISVLEKRANEVKNELVQKSRSFFSVKVEREVAKVGGGAFPTLEVPTVVLSFSLSKEKLLEFERKLRISNDPQEISIIGRIHKNRFLIDFRTIFEGDIPILKKRLSEVLF